MKARREALRAKRIPIAVPNEWSLAIPPEVWLQLLRDNCGPKKPVLDVMSLGRLQLVCRDLYHLVHGSWDLWKSVWISYGKRDWKYLLAYHRMRGRADEAAVREKGAASLIKHFAKRKVMKCAGCSTRKVLS